MPGKNVLQMGQELLDTFGGLAGLLHTTAGDLQRINTLQLTQLRERDKIKNLRGTLSSAKDLGTIIF